jgi:hypothetical protein
MFAGGHGFDFAERTVTTLIERTGLPDQVYQFGMCRGQIHADSLGFCLILLVISVSLSSSIDVIATIGGRCRFLVVYTADCVKTTRSS